MSKKMTKISSTPCPVCGNPIYPGDRFCTDCGTNLNPKHERQDESFKPVLAGVIILGVVVILFLGIRSFINGNDSGSIVEPETASSETISSNAVSENLSAGQYVDSVNDDSVHMGNEVGIIAWSNWSLESAVKEQLGISGEISADDAASVKSLDLTGLGIGDISDLAYFTGLQELFLGSNSITDISSLSHMEKLQILNLEKNYIRDLSPLSRLTDLRRLDLYQNRIEDISELESLTGLVMLDIRENSVRDIDALSHMTAMKELYLSNNNISSIEPVRKMDKLEYLGLKYNPISDISPVAGKDSIGILILEATDVRDVRAVETLYSLHFLDITNCMIYDYGPIDRLRDRGVTIKE